MPLITCPECGRENVSDSAESCPVCGYNIKTYIEKQNERSRENEKWEVLLEHIKMPAEPSSKFEIQELKLLIGGIVLFALSLCFITFPPLMCIFMVAAVIIASIAFIQNKKKKEKMMQDYLLAQRDFEKYKQQIIREEKMRMVKEHAQYRTVLKCPQCKSINVDKISTASRVASVAVVGVASGKIGKQYKCNNCKHMW